MMRFRNDCRLYLLWCLFTLGCMTISVTADCGNCTGGCNASQICHNGDCTLENVALGKPVILDNSTSYTTSEGTHHVCRSVNGKKDIDEQCIESGQQSPNPFWEVDLGQNYSISLITIYRRYNWTIRMVNMSVYVDDQPCDVINITEALGNLSSVAVNSPVPIGIKCSPSPLTGRIVRLEKNTSGQQIDQTYFSHILSVCEVSVWAPRITTTSEEIITSMTVSITKSEEATTFPITNQTSNTPTNHINPATENSTNPGTPTTTTTSTTKQTGSTTTLSSSPTTTTSTTSRTTATTTTNTTKPASSTSTRSSPTTKNSTVTSASTVTSSAPSVSTNEPGLQHGEEKDTSVPIGAIVGGTVGSLVAVAAVVVIVIFLIRRKRKYKQDQPDSIKSVDDTVKNRSSSSDSVSVSPTVIVKKDKPVQPVKPILPPKPAIVSRSLKTGTGNGTRTKNETLATVLSSPKHSLTPIAEQISEDVTAVSRATESEELEQDETYEESNVYQNRESVYAAFRQSALHMDRVQTYLVDRLASEVLNIDFKTIPILTEGQPRTYGSMLENARKNRFTFVYPYDSNRVVLVDGYTDGYLANDYINASYISGFRRDREYIAAQGPKDDTAGDFWRMVGQEQITHIVMLTNLQEKEKIKCFKYWPDESDHVTHGPVTVTSARVECRDNFYIRTFLIQRIGSRESREVTHYHYISWPDFGVPTTASLVSFWRYVIKEARAEGETASRPPVLVHCSAGVGRTGTFIALDIAMQQAVEKDEVDLMELVQSLRDQRCLMVQATEQFVFLHTALLEAYTSRDAVLPVDTFATVFAKPVKALQSYPRIDREFKMLMKMRSSEEEPTYETVKEKTNKKKNRNPDILPADPHLVHLTEKAAGRNQYINAVYMPTLRDSQGSVTTQLPLPSTLVDFWRLVYGKDVTMIVSLSSPAEELTEKSYCKYWPREEKEKIRTGSYTVSFQSVSQKSDHLKAYSLKLDKAGVFESRDVQVLHYEGWKGEVGDNPGEVLSLIDTLITSQSSSASKPYIVQCLDGVGKCGLFCALCNVINRMMYDREVDVYMTVRHVQSVAPKAVTSIAQYRYLYQMAQQRCLDMKIYANE